MCLLPELNDPPDPPPSLLNDPPDPPPPYRSGSWCCGLPRQPPKVIANRMSNGHPLMLSSIFKQHCFTTYFVPDGLL